MKRDLLLLFLCLCILGGAAWMGRDRVVSAVTAPVDVERVLILDAGHGGEDGGASSASGKMESGINLDIVLKTEALMAFLGVRTELTRSEDRSMHSEGARTIREKKVSDLKNRAAFISGFPNAMLISVHQNHFTDTRYSGAQTFYSTGDTSRQWGEGTQEVLRQTLDLQAHAGWNLHVRAYQLPRHPGGVRFSQQRGGGVPSADRHIPAENRGGTGRGLCPGITDDTQCLERRMTDGKGKKPVLLYGMWK